MASTDETLPDFTGATMFDLQDRTHGHMEKIKDLHIKGKQAKSTAGFAALAHQEIEEYGECNAYPAVGRAFILKPFNEVLAMLENEVEENMKVMEQVKPEIKFHEDKLKQCEQELGEVMKGRDKD